MKKISENLRSLSFNLYFFGLWGAQIIILFIYILDYTAISQSFTVPYRIIFALFCLIAFFIHKTWNQINNNLSLQLIFLFYLLILFRILADTYFFPKPLGTPGTTYLLRFGAMVIIPSLGFIIKLENSAVNHARNGIKYCSIIFLLLGFYLYSDIIGSNYRSIQHTSDWTTEELISPMIFSYIGLSLFGIIIWELLYQKKYSFYNFLLLLLSIFGLLWGGTRNSIVVVFLLLFFITVQQTTSIKKLIKILFFWIISIAIGFYMLKVSGTKILQRFDQLISELQSGDQDAGSYRLGMWKRGWEQFSNSPFFGSGIEEKGAKYVAHNMYLETLMSIGALGAILLLFIIWITIKRGKRLLEINSSIGWLTILFLERLFSGMMSTSILDPLFWLPVVAINANYKYIMKYENVCRH